MDDMEGFGSLLNGLDNNWADLVHGDSADADSNDVFNFGIGQDALPVFEDDIPAGPTDIMPFPPPGIIVPPDVGKELRHGAVPPSGVGDVGGSDMDMDVGIGIGGGLPEMAGGVHMGGAGEDDGACAKGGGRGGAKGRKGSAKDPSKAKAEGGKEEEEEGKASAPKRRRQNLTPDERAKQNRDRNREHARNTRLRKKAYVEELKRTVQDLVAKRERDLRQRRMQQARSQEQHEVQFKVLSALLNYRGSYMTDRRKWSAILSPTFAMRLPLTRYRSFPSGKAGANWRELSSLEDLAGDLENLRAFATHLGGSASPMGVTFGFAVDPKDVIYKGDSLMAQWSAVSDGYVANGARSEVAWKGMVHCQFDSVNKVRSVELLWDSVGLSRSFAAVARSIHEAKSGAGPSQEHPPPSAPEMELLRQLLDDVCSNRISSTVLRDRLSSSAGADEGTLLRVFPLSHSSDSAEESKDGTVHFVGVLESLAAKRRALEEADGDESLPEDERGAKRRDAAKRRKDGKAAADEGRTRRRTRSSSRRSG